MERVEKRVLNLKKDKAFYRIIKRWLQGEEIDELEVAVNLSSMLTHCLIEIKENSKKSRSVGFVLATELCIDFQSQCIKELIYGNRTLSEIRKAYLERFGDGFGIKQG